MRASKGSQFERDICRKLSLWWSKGMRDDIFWRCSQSGGRATTRAKKGKRTFGSYGDITAVDPIGSPLLRAFTIELKRGKSGGFPGDTIDMEELPAKNPWVKTLKQVRRSRKLAGSETWMVIMKRDRRKIMVYMPESCEYVPSDGCLQHCAHAILHFDTNHILAMGLDDWLEMTPPSSISSYAH